MAKKQNNNITDIYGKRIRELRTSLKKNHTRIVGDNIDVGGVVSGNKAVNAIEKKNY